MEMVIRRPRRLILAVAMLAAVSTLALPGHAHASYSSCRSDPALVLTNGSVLDLSASIGADLSNVSSVTYVVHLPAKVGVLLAVNTDSLMGIKEHFVTYSDDTSNTYDAYTTVQLTSGTSTVTANETVISVLQLSISSPNVSGASGTAIHQHVKASFLGL
jgi:hypothetical protein